MAFSQSDTSSRSTVTTTTTNAQNGASEGSIAFGMGSSGNSVTTSDAKTVKAAADAIQASAETSIKEGNLTARTVTHDALNFGSDVVGKNSQIALETVKAAQDTSQQANDMLQRSFETYTGALSRNAGDAPSTVAADSQRNLLIAGGAVLVAVLFLTLRKQS